MSTNGMTSWAVDLKDVGAIYPFQGWEVLMVILGIHFLDRLAHYPDAPGKCGNCRRLWLADRSGDETRAAIDRYY